MPRRTTTTPVSPPVTRPSVDTRPQRPTVSTPSTPARPGWTPGANRPARPTTPSVPARPTVTPAVTPTVTPTVTPQVPTATTASVRSAVHFQGPVTFEGARIKASVLDSVYGGVKPEKFGTTDVKLTLADGSSKSHNVRDMHYDLGNGKVGMRLIPVKDNDAAGSAQMDAHLRKEMGLKPEDPIFSLIAYVKPQEHTGDLKALATTMLL